MPTQKADAAFGSAPRHAAETCFHVPVTLVNSSGLAGFGLVATYPAQLVLSSLTGEVASGPRTRSPSAAGAGPVPIAAAASPTRTVGATTATERLTAALPIPEGKQRNVM